MCTKFIVWDKIHILGKIASSKNVGGVFGLFSNFWSPTWTEMRRNGTSKWMRSKGKCWCLADLVLWGRSHQVWSTVDERMNWDSHQATSSPVYHHQPERILENYKHDHVNVHMIIKIRTNLTNICTILPVPGQKWPLCWLCGHTWILDCQLSRSWGFDHSWELQRIYPEGPRPHPERTDDSPSMCEAVDLA